VSRIGKLPVDVPSGVSVERVEGGVCVKGPHGTLSERLPAAIDVAIEPGVVKLSRRDDRKPTRALHGLARALVANMVRGVTQPFVKELEIQGLVRRTSPARPCASRSASRTPSRWRSPRASRCRWIATWWCVSRV
jgi:large subunit ribosomal protein L6